MNNEEMITSTHGTFEGIRRFDSNGNEYWLARELGPLLDYHKWQNFELVIEKAVVACQQSGKPMADHFTEISKMVDLGSGSRRKIKDFELSRYACYLILQNGDSSKPVIANGQTYFAFQTRRQELSDSEYFKQLTEDERRLAIRNELTKHNKDLAAVAKKSGVVTSLDYAIFQDHGYKGLYGGRGAKEIHEIKGLKKSQKILDHMGSTELAANLFRATQTEDKLQRNQVRGKELANQTHLEVGKKVRQTIEELGGTMPEALPAESKSIKQLERSRKKVEIPREVT